VATASTIVSASTASTNEARNAVVIAGPMCIKLSVTRCLRDRHPAATGQKCQIKAAFSNKNEFKVWEYNPAEARARNPNPESQVLRATPIIKQHGLWPTLNTGVRCVAEIACPARSD
jgi:hypothetical protein